MREAILEPCPPDNTNDPAPGTFEIGLALAGAISAGAYTAGVIDFLIEALDAWEKAKEEEYKKHAEDGKTYSVPYHQVKLKVIAGASAGSIVAAIAAAALRYDFKHVDASEAQNHANSDQNPMYRAWVTEIDIAKLLKSRDLEQDPEKVHSLLDSTCLNEIADNAMNYQGLPIQRPYLSDPLCLIYTLNNLRGVPYLIDMIGNSGAGAGYAMTAHADHMRFALTGLQKVSTPICAGGVALTYPNSSGLQPWKNMAETALASGAFPLFLKPRELDRPCSDYKRSMAIPGCPSTTQLISPTWPPTEPDPYRYLCVDGGSMNNEPIELARIELAGMAGRNPRDGKKAHRAVVLIDPFVAPDELGPASDRGLLNTASSMFKAWIAQCRCKLSDLALAQDESIYSRFLISPSRGSSRGASNDYDIASSLLSGFGGFLDERFRQHDYLLGRRNCQNFLREHFKLPAENPLFNGWNEKFKNDPRYLSNNWKTGVAELPIIPLMDQLQGDQGLPAWPRFYTRQQLDELQAQIGQRADAVFAATIRNLFFLKRWALKLVWNCGCKSFLINKAKLAIETDLQKKGLMS